MPHRYLFKDLQGFDAARLVVGPTVLDHNDFEYHTHDFSEIAIIRSGTCVHRVMNETSTIRAGDVYVFNGNAAHAFEHTRKLHVFNIMFDPEMYLRPYRDLKNVPGFHSLFLLEPSLRSKKRFEGHLRLSPREMAFLEPKLDALHEEFLAQRPGRQAMLACLFKEIVVHLSRLYTVKAARGATHDIHRIAEAVACMEQRFAEPLRLVQLARMAHLSVNQFLRLFREVYETSPTDYLIRRRVAHACELIRQGDEKMTAIAEACGFSDSNYLSRQFRRVMGMSPKEFKKLHAFNR